MLIQSPRMTAVLPRFFFFKSIKSKVYLFYEEDANASPLLWECRAHGRRFASNDAFWSYHCRLQLKKEGFYTSATPVCGSSQSPVLWRLQVMFSAAFFSVSANSNGEVCHLEKCVFSQAGPRPLFELMVVFVRSKSVLISWNGLTWKL